MPRSNLGLAQIEKSILEYDDFRTYLRDRYQHLKAKDKKFSFRYFAREAGFKSPSFLKLVMDGKSNLSPESIAKFSKALKHSKMEAEFFRLLVLLNQASTVDEKKHYAEEILKSRGYRKVHPLNEALYRYLSQWHFVVIKEMVDLKGFREDPEWISRELNSTVTPGEVKRAIKEMLDLGILGRNDQGKLSQIKTFMMTPDEVASSSAADYHRAMINKAAAAIDSVPRPKRELSGLTVSVSKETAAQIKSMIQKFRKDIMSICTTDTQPDRIYQINLHLFPLVEPGEVEGEDD